MSAEASSPTSTLETYVREELDWSPGLLDGDIVVREPEDGVIVLSGEVESSGARVDAVEAAYRVKGVTTVVDELRVAEGPPLDADGMERIAADVNAVIGR